jgi:16S rRNA (uracil1498-N3)-methyltransferase
MSTFYAPSLQQDHSHYQLSEEESKHCIKVLRMQVGDQIELINGKGLQAFTILEDAHPKRSVVGIKTSHFYDSTPTIHIAMAPTKNMDRVEWYLEKATELGLSKLTFLLCDHSERKLINMERLEKIAIAAMKQSKRFYLPELEVLQRLEDFIVKYPKGYFGHCEEGNKIRWNDVAKDFPFLIGPEGDFSSKEIKVLLESGYQAVEMSSFRLRTETAALLATTALLTH